LHFSFDLEDNMIVARASGSAALAPPLRLAAARALLRNRDASAASAASLAASSSLRPARGSSRDTRALPPLLADGARIYLEDDAPLVAPDGWTLLRHDRAGRVFYGLLTCTPHASASFTPVPSIP
jgi:hypothetical protein